MKNIATHVTSILSAAGAVVALVHPGFKLPAGVQGITVTLCILVSAAIQAYHSIATHSLQASLKAAEAWGQHIANDPAKPAA